MVCSRCRRRGDRIRIFVLLPDPQSGTVHRDQRTVLSSEQAECRCLYGRLLMMRSTIRNCRQESETKESCILHIHSSVNLQMQYPEVFSSFALGIIGYQVSEAVQTTEVVNRIWKTYTGSYVIGYGLAALVLFLLYPLGKKKTQEMLEQLKAKRAANAAK